MTRKQSENVAQKIKIFMMENGISQRELAKKMKVAPQTVSQFLGGKYDLRMETIEKISKALGAPGNYFFAEVKGSAVGPSAQVRTDGETKKDIALIMAKITALESKIENLELKYNLLKKENK